VVERSRIRVEWKCPSRRGLAVSGWRRGTDRYEVKDDLELNAHDTFYISATIQQAPSHRIEALRYIDGFTARFTALDKPLAVGRVYNMLQHPTVP
jgi:hypothetical protein